MRKATGASKTALSKSHKMQSGGKAPWKQLATKATRKQGSWQKPKNQTPQKLCLGDPKGNLAFPEECGPSNSSSTFPKTGARDRTRL